jgi:DNA phosphorothioation-dependent restriction protein DptH
MSVLIEHLANFVKREFLSGVESSPESNFRVIFSAAPLTYMSELYSLLTQGTGNMLLDVSGEDVEVPVFLIENNTGTSEYAAGSNFTSTSLLKIRNSDALVWLALQEVGAATSSSIVSTSNSIGISKEISEFDVWLDTPVIKFLLEKYCADLKVDSNEEYIDAALKFSLLQSWDVDYRYKDKRTIWRLLEKLLGASIESVPAYQIFSATLGLPYCEQKDIGGKGHLKTLERVSDLFQSVGLRAGFDELESNSTEELLSHVKEFRQHIEDQGVIEANEFTKSYLELCCPVSIGAKSIPEWWFALTVDAWSQLLSAGDDADKPESGVLEVTLSNLVVAVPKGMVPFVNESVNLKIENKSDSETLDFVIARSSGNATLVEVFGESISSNQSIDFEDNDVPTHDRFIRYKVSAEGYAPVTIKVIVLDRYGPGVIALSSGSSKATPFKVNKKARDAANKKIERFECDLSLSGMGSHILDLYTSRSAVLSQVIRGYEVDAEDTGAIERTVSKINDNHYSCLIETDEECHYDIDVYSPGLAAESPFRIYITAAESNQLGAASEFDRLVMMHRSSATGANASPRVDPLTCRLMDLEVWTLENGNSYLPVIFGPDYLDSWQKPFWDQAPVFSGLTMLVDPRPKPNEINAPTDFLLARAKVFAHLGTPQNQATPPAASLKLYEYMRDEIFVALVSDFLDTYLSWLSADYDNASWIDLISLHASQTNAKALESVPYAIMLSPFHPIKLAWQCCAQDVLQRAIDKHERCPAASVVNSMSFPDCFVLPCKNTLGTRERRSFVAMASSSDYWGVMLSVGSSDMNELVDERSVFGDDLGINVDGLASGFSGQQVVRSLDEVSRLMSAKSTLNIGISSDAGGSSSCNEGVDAWCTTNLGSEADYWEAAGPRSLVINDERDSSLHPEQAILASLTNRTDAAVRWFTGQSAKGKQENDLSIIAHLSTLSRQFAKQGIRSAIDVSALSRWRVRKQLPQQNAVFIAESRIGEISPNLGGDSLTAKLSNCVDEIERQCRDEFDSYIFAPDMAKLGEVVSHSRYTALSSSDIDAACFFGTTDGAYLWDYELPSYSRRAGENTGYYLLAKESQGMLHAVRSAVKLLGKEDELSDDVISSMLEEISRRGMPTLKRLTAGGSMSLGEIGMLTALRVFQSEFEDEPASTGLLPVGVDEDTLNIIISADPFQKHFDDLRTAIGFKNAERPDLLVFSVRFISGLPVQMQITPIEVKARSGSMSAKERASALGQASNFALFIKEIQAKANSVELWGIAWRNLLATMLDYGFRVYGQLDKFMKHNEWAAQHSNILKSIASNELDIEVDGRGRLLIIDSSGGESKQDADGDNFHETICLTHAEAFSVLTRNDLSFTNTINANMGDWELQPKGFIVPAKAIDTVVADGDDPYGTPAPSPAPSTESNPFPSQEYTPSPELGSVAAPSPSEVSGIKFNVGRTINQFSAEELDFFPGNTALNQLNVGIVGDLGTGKTQLIQALVQQITADSAMNRGKRPNVLIFDYKRDYSKPDFVKATGARVVSPFDIPLNLFDIRDSTNKKRALLERGKFFIDVLGKLYPGIGAVQHTRIKTAVKDAYGKATNAGKVAPTINDVFDSYKEDGKTPDTPYTVMDDLVDGEYFVSNCDDVIPFSELLDGVVVLDLAEVGQDDKTKNMLVVIFLNLFYEYMLRIEKKEFVGNDPQLRFIDTMLLVDEADNIMKHEFDVLKKILLQGREFGVGVLLASQYLSHFKTSHENYLEPLLSWFVHKVPNVTVKELEGIGLTGVNSDVVDTIKSLNCHECLYKTLGVDGKVMRATPFFELMRDEEG